MNRALASGPIVWLGIIVVTCLLLVLFQTVLWLVMPVLLAVVLYYILSPLVKYGISKGLSRSRAVLITTVLLMTAVLVLVGFSIAPKVTMGLSFTTLPDKIQEYTKVGITIRFQDAERTLNEQFHVHAAQGSCAGYAGRRRRILASTARRWSRLRPRRRLMRSRRRTTWRMRSPRGRPSIPATSRWSWRTGFRRCCSCPTSPTFFLLDGPRFKRFLVQAIPNAFFEKTLYLFYRVERPDSPLLPGAAGAYRARCALPRELGLWFLGLHEPFLLAVIAAIMAWLPYLGSIGGGLLVALVAAKNFPDNAYMPYEVVGSSSPCGCSMISSSCR